MNYYVQLAHYTVAFILITLVTNTFAKGSMVQSIYGRCFIYICLRMERVLIAGDNMLLQHLGTKRVYLLCRHDT